MISSEILLQRPGRFTVRWDDAHGSASADLEGCWSADDVAAFYPAIRDAIDRSRARHGHALVLFDTRCSEVIGDVLTANFRSSGSQFIGPEDRVALIFQSNLLKLQVKRLSSHGLAAEFFVSRNAAETWLHAHVRLAA